jgi:hypothetical protein
MSDNKKRASEDGNDVHVASKRPQTNPSGNQKFDVEAVAETWSPESTRLNRREKKVTSLEDSNLRGGNFVLDCEGNATTLSFAFEKDGALYGLTAGHLADVGDSIFVFLLSSKTPNDFDDEESFEMMEVGEVVSKNIETDSLIFGITHPFMNGKVDLLKLLPGSGLADHALHLPEPNSRPAAPPIYTKVVLYGAMRRGENGIVKYPSKQSAGTVSKKSDIGIASAGDGARPLTSGGDCGAICMTENGLGLAMHHCLQGEEEAPYVSFGVPLASILAKHSLFGGNPDAVESQQLMAFPKDKHRESRNIAKFDTKITKAVPPLGGTPIDEADVYESRDIAHFENVRIVKTSGTGK